MRALRGAKGTTRRGSAFETADDNPAHRKTGANADTKAIQLNNVVTSAEEDVKLKF
jgi:hypothetical protein